MRLGKGTYLLIEGKTAISSMYLLLALSLLSVFAICFISPTALFAQVASKDYYIFPIRPGQPNYLSGNMGELRANHFHAGIDVRTGGVEGLPVVAAASGYISRLKMSTWGYGNVLYIQHPNGETTVYAHLQRFVDKIADHVRSEQYKQKTFELELFPGPSDFIVKQGEVIGYSGNTGGSGGPHLHFEIRDKNQEVLNPLLYGFVEVNDNIAPEIEKVALVTLDKDARVNDQFGRFEFDVIRSGNTYAIRQPINVHGKIGIEILGFDRANGAPNKNGISTIETFLGEERIFKQDIRRFAFAQTRNILVLHNYMAFKETGKRFYKLYIDEGNDLPFYEETKNKGIITIDSGATANLTINFYDSYANQSSLRFTLQDKLPSPVLSQQPKGGPQNYSALFKNVLKISSENKQMAAIHANRMVYEQPPQYTHPNGAVYLWDMRWGLPDSILIGQETWQFNYRAMVPSRSVFNLYTQEANIHFPRGALFDTLYMQTSYWQDASKEVFDIGEDIIPLKRNITVSLKSKLKYAHKKRTHVYRISDNGNYNFEGGEWENGNIKFNTRNFGSFTLLTDTIPPTVNIRRISNEEISFIIKDELSGIHSYEAYLNGAWLLMHYDYKRNLIWSDRLDKKKPLVGDFRLKVLDQAGNEFIYSIKL